MAGLIKRIVEWERAKRRAYQVTDLSTPENRKMAETYNFWFDHEMFRRLWSNFAQIGPGAYRSNNPTVKRFEKIRALGIKTIINLRGPSTSPYYLIEKEQADAAGITMIDLSLKATVAPPRDVLLELIDVLHSVEKPFLMHCKSGADRAGLGSAIYKLVVLDEPIEEAKKMLSWRFIHFRKFKTGVLDLILETYEIRNQVRPIDFELWVATEYDPQKIQATFDASRKGKIELPFQ